MIDSPFVALLVTLPNTQFVFAWDTTLYDAMPGDQPYEWQYLSLAKLRSEQAGNGEHDDHSRTLLAIPTWADKDARLRDGEP